MRLARAQRGRTVGSGLLALCGLALAATAPAAASSPSGQERAADAGRTLIGTAAPPLVLTTIDGQRIDLGRLYGHQAVYLKFWATWCVPCREQMPHLQQTFRTAGADLVVIAINAGFNDTLADVRDYRRRLGLTLPIVLDDGRLGAAFHLRVTPQHVVIGRDGRILYVGHLADAPLEDALQAARSAGPAGAAAANHGAAHLPPAEAAYYRVGDRLPELTVRTLDGGTFFLGRSGKPTVLAFLSPWCESYLADSRPQLAGDCRGAREQVEARAADSQVRWLGVASGLWASAEDLANYREQYRVTIPLTLDESGRLFREFRVTTVPTLLLIDGSGRIVRRVAGAAAASPQGLRTLLPGGG
ncbi:MAG TPA: TlpA disulfide reductase family protein [Steroidobacteraceae bacterium]|nr:TlpA disulfide reductase family protein [Steroidobacteraceae bacterium]